MNVNIYSYFLFSKEQMDVKKQTEKKLGNTYVPGKVIVKGARKLFTEIRTDKDSKFKDAVIVAEGIPKNMTYILDTVL